MKKIAVIDFGVGNIWSIAKAVKLFTENFEVTEDIEKVRSADALILPGVGAFAAGMEGLRRRGLIEPILKAGKKNLPILGICLGAEILFDKGLEFGEHQGLGLIKGSVASFPSLPTGVKVPNIGWRKVSLKTGKEGDPVLKTLIEKPAMYFNHSYIMLPENETENLAVSEHGEFSFSAVAGTGNIYGTQFHPEKSGPAGLSLLQNFIQLALKI